jgi:hypothetical protein
MSLYRFNTMQLVQLKQVVVTELPAADPAQARVT